MKFSESDFASALLKDLKTLYRANTLSKYKQLYALAAFPIQRKAGVVLGINWGGSGTDYVENSHLPAKSEFWNGYRNGDYQFLHRSNKYFKEHAGIDLEQTDFNYTNLCFFRTAKEKQLSHEHYNVCFPMFKELIEYIQPKWIICLGVTVVKRLKRIPDNSLDNLKRQPELGSGSYGWTGTFAGFPFYCVPHPNARIKGHGREEVWNSVFNGFKENHLK